MPEIPLVMPKMSMTMTEGIFVAWHKQPGDAVRSGDVVCEVTTDKVDMDVESPVDGVLARLVAEPDDVIPVGEPIAFLTSDADDLLGDLLGGDPPDGSPNSPDETANSPRGTEDSPRETGDSPESASPPRESPELRGESPASRGESPEPRGESRVSRGESRVSTATRNGWVAAVPLARVRAAELDVDLARLTGTGPGGAVRVVDVESAARPVRRPAADPAVRRRAALARRLTESAAVPQFTVFRDLDLDALAGARDGVSWTAILLAAYAAVLRTDPALHARWSGEQRVELDEIVVSVAVDTPDGLLAPSITAPDRLPLREVDEAVRALAARAREGRLAVADLAPGTTTVSNLGGMGVESFTAVLTPPQATVLSLGAVGPVPVAIPGGVGVGVRCRAGLTVDHRVADGADAARLLQRLQDRLADPASVGL